MGTVRLMPETSSNRFDAEWDVTGEDRCEQLAGRTTERDGGLGNGPCGSCGAAEAV
jgi:hypothetical protein